jgi:hypothetical protein
VSVCVQQCSVQCKGYNLIGVTTMEASETRGTTALVYCLIGSSVYTGTVQGWWSTPPTGLTVGRGEVHPNWSDGQQGRSQLSTFLYLILYGTVPMKKRITLFQVQFFKCNGTVAERYFVTFHQWWAS